MKDYESFPPLKIVRAQGCTLYPESGKPLLDVISSWWCKPLGHGHARLRAALNEQSKHFEHVIFAHTTSTLLETLSQRLLQLAPGLDKVFYSGDGSSAIEIALKLSLQYHANVSGPGKRTQFAYLSGAYHGENLFCLAVSDLELYKAPFAALCPPMVRLPQHCRVQGRDDVRWQRGGDDWPQIAAVLDAHAQTLAGIIVEPIVQGAGGMHIYSPVLLQQLRRWTQQHGVHLIADEVMTGLGRTGKAFAVEHAGITPDISVLMKGLSGGFMPFSAILSTQTLYDAFYDDWESGKAFIHSNTYSGNALGAAVALAALDVYAEEDYFARVAQQELTLRAILEQVARSSGLLNNVRGIGGLAAADLTLAPTQTLPRPAFALYLECVKRGALLRPLGQTIYLLPPFTMTSAELTEVGNILSAALNALAAIA